jgi:hypothetical protein
MSFPIFRAWFMDALDTSIRVPTGNEENLGDASPRRVADAVGVGERTRVQREDVGRNGGGEPDLKSGSEEGMVYLMLGSFEGAINTSFQPC